MVTKSKFYQSNKSYTIIEKYPLECMFVYNLFAHNMSINLLHFSVNMCVYLKILGKFCALRQCKLYKLIFNQYKQIN